MPATFRVPRRPSRPAVENAVASAPLPVAVEPFADDLLAGANAIAKFIFGRGAHARRAHTAIRQGLPVFRIGNRLFARKSAISLWIAAQEHNATTR